MSYVCLFLALQWQWWLRLRNAFWIKLQGLVDILVPSHHCFTQFSADFIILNKTGGPLFISVEPQLVGDIDSLVVVQPKSTGLKFARSKERQLHIWSPRHCPQGCTIPVPASVSKLEIQGWEQVSGRKERGERGRGDTESVSIQHPYDTEQA
jgi:hypothetical protein